MSTASLDLPDPLADSAEATAADADELIARLADDAIDKMMQEAETGRRPARRIESTTANAESSPDRSHVPDVTPEQQVSAASPETSESSPQARPEESADARPSANEESPVTPAGPAEPAAMPTVSSSNSTPAESQVQSGEPLSGDAVPAGADRTTPASDERWNVSAVGDVLGSALGRRSKGDVDADATGEVSNLRSARSAVDETGTGNEYRGEPLKPADETTEAFTGSSADEIKVGDGLTGSNQAGPAQSALISSKPFEDNADANAQLADADTSPVSDRPGDTADTSMTADAVSPLGEARNDVKALLDESAEHVSKGQAVRNAVLLPLKIVNAPLDYLPDTARQVAGQIAIITLINAIAVILYVVLFRK